MSTTQAKESARASAKSSADSATKAADAFSFGMNTTDIPVAVREFADRAIDQAKAFYGQAKTAAEEANGMIEDSIETARQSARSLSLKTLDAVQSTADASFNFFKDLMGVKSFADAVELQTSFARKQWDAAAEQFKDFQDSAQKAMAESAKPGRVAWAKAFKAV